MLLRAYLLCALVRAADAARTFFSAPDVEDDKLAVRLTVEALAERGRIFCKSNAELTDDGFRRSEYLSAASARVVNPDSLFTAAQFLTLINDVDKRYQL